METKSKDLFMVILTKDRYQYLLNIFDSSGVSGERIFCIRTNFGDPFEGVNNIFVSNNEINIQKWWNIGLRAVMESDGRYVPILNDDVIIKKGQLQNLLDSMLVKEVAFVCGANSNGGK